MIKLVCDSACTDGRSGEPTVSLEPISHGFQLQVQFGGFNTETNREGTPCAIAAKNNTGEWEKPVEN